MTLIRLKLKSIMSTKTLIFRLQKINKQIYKIKTNE